MQNFPLLLWTIIGLAAAWLIAMTVNRNIFMHYDIDRTVQGTTLVKFTDIADQCGTNTDPNDAVEYKLSEEGQIIYLCPQGIWPIQKVVAAVTLTPEFRRRLNPLLLKKIVQFYPEQVAQPSVNPFVAK